MFKKILLATVLLFSMTQVYAAPAKDLDQLLQNLKSIEADFTQTIYDNKHRPVQTSYGKMAFTRPDQFRWEVTKPIPQLIIANGTKLYIYDKDLDQLTIRKLTKAVGETPALLLSHDDVMQLEKNYDVTDAKSPDDKSRWFRLTPKGENSMFAWVEMGFDGKTLIGMRLHDNLDHLTDIDFKNVKANTKINKNIFSFKPPKGVDVIDETKPTPQQ